MWGSEGEENRKGRTIGRATPRYEISKAIQREIGLAVGFIDSLGEVDLLGGIEMIIGLVSIVLVMKTVVGEESVKTKPVLPRRDE